MARNLEATAGAFQSGQIDAADFTREIENATAAANETVVALGEIDGVDLSGIVGRIGAVIGALTQAAQQARETRAAIADATAEEGISSGPQNGRKPKVTIKPSELAPTTSIRPQLPSVNHNFGVPDAPKKTTGTGGGGGASAARQDDYEREIAALRELTGELELQALALAAVSAGGRDLSNAIGAAEQKASLLAAALREGRADSPALRAEIDAQVQAWSRAATAADQAREKLERVEDARQQLSDAGESAFVGLVTGALSFREALSQVLGELARMAASALFKRILGGLFGGATGGGILGSLLGFAGGGYTGDGGQYEPAGVVHKGEYVLSKAATERLGVDNLEALHSAALRGYSNGGLVGAAAPAIRTQRAATAPQITISAPVTVNGSAGTPEQNTDLAKRMSRELEQTMKAVVANEIRTAMRPGGTLNRK